MDGYSCICNSGFDGDGVTCEGILTNFSFQSFNLNCCYLIDIDECANETHDCDMNETCTNTIGSYACT